MPARPTVDRAPRDVSGRPLALRDVDLDAFLHPKMFKQLSTLLWGLVRGGAQVAVATHSPELIDACARDLNGDAESKQFGVYGLTRDPKGSVALALRLPGQAVQNPERRAAIRELLGL